MAATRDSSEPCSPPPFASLRSDPNSRAYYQRKRDQGKHHNQAILALAYRRILTLHAMIRNGTLYDPQPSAQLPAALDTPHRGTPLARHLMASYEDGEPHNRSGSPHDSLGWTDELPS